MIEYSHFDNLTTGVFESTDTVQVIDVPRLHLYPDRLKRVADTYNKFSWDKIASVGEDEPHIHEWVFPENKLFTGVQYSNDVVGYDIDYYEPETDDGDPSGKKVTREKIYCYEWTHRRFGKHLPWARYWYDLVNDLECVVEKLLPAFDLPENSYTQRQLNIVKYECKEASNNEELKIHRRESSDRFGVDHIDGTLFGLHLGESHPEIHAKPDGADEYVKPDLTGNKVLLLVGEHAADLMNGRGTDHRLFYNGDYLAKSRYSLILDITLRFNDEEDLEHPM